MEVSHYGHGQRHGAGGLWTFLETRAIEPTNNAAELALRQSVIQRKISHGVQSASGAVCRSRLLTVTTTLSQKGRDVWQFLHFCLVPQDKIISKEESLIAQR